MIPPSLPAEGQVIAYAFGTPLQWSECQWTTRREPPPLARPPQHNMNRCMVTAQATPEGLFETRFWVHSMCISGQVIPRLSAELIHNAHLPFMRQWSDRIDELPLGYPPDERFDNVLGQALSPEPDGLGYTSNGPLSFEAFECPGDWCRYTVMCHFDARPFGNPSGPIAIESASTLCEAKHLVAVRLRYVKAELDRWISGAQQTA